MPRRACGVGGALIMEGRLKRKLDKAIAYIFGFGTIGYTGWTAFSGSAVDPNVLGFLLATQFMWWADEYG